MEIVDALIASPWSRYAAIVLMATGAMLILRAAGRMGIPNSGSDSLLRWIRRFRAAAIGLAVFGVGAAWLWQQPWLLAVALGIGLEETLESSSYIAALEQRRSARPNKAAPG